MNQRKRGTIFMYKKKSTIGKIPQDPLKEIAQDYDLTMEEIQLLQKCFKRYDTLGINAIQWYEVDDVYRDMEIDISDSIRDLIVDQLKQFEQRAADFTLVAKIWAEIKKLREREEEEADQMETINAFVAMGGNYDRTGLIPKNIIIQIIKEDFQLDFDIEGYLEKQGLGNTDELSYSDFYKIFEQNEEGKELLSTYSQGMFKANKGNKIQEQQGRRVKTEVEDEEAFVVNYKDFENWLSTQEQLQQMGQDI